MQYFYNSDDRADSFSQQRIGEAAEEGKGGHIRATLLSNRATTLVKVLDRFNIMHFHLSYDFERSLKNTMKLWQTQKLPLLSFRHHSKHCALVPASIFTLRNSMLQ